MVNIARVFVTLEKGSAVINVLCLFSLRLRLVSTEKNNELIAFIYITHHSRN